MTIHTQTHDDGQDYTLYPTYAYRLQQQATKQQRASCVHHCTPHLIEYIRARSTGVSLPTYLPTATTRKIARPVLRGPRGLSLPKPPQGLRAPRAPHREGGHDRPAHHHGHRCHRQRGRDERGQTKEEHLRPKQHRGGSRPAFAWMHAVLTFISPLVHRKVAGGWRWRSDKYGIVKKKGPFCSGEVGASRRTPRPCSVCGSPRLCRRRERRLVGARFGRWREERFGRVRCLTSRYSLLLSVWVDPSAEHIGGLGPRLSRNAAHRFARFAICV